MIQIKKYNKQINENLVINKYLKKLNFNKSSTFNFENDGAVLKVPKNKEIVVSHDTLIENVHFFKNDLPQSIAAKAIRTNLSDLASMGAQPYAYSMSLSLTKNITKKWLDQFTKFLFREQNKFNFFLLGGDIVNSQYLSISITIFGFLVTVLTLKITSKARIGSCTTTISALEKCFLIRIREMKVVFIYLINLFFGLLKRWRIDELR